MGIPPYPGVYKGVPELYPGVYKGVPELYPGGV